MLKKKSFQTCIIVQRTCTCIAIFSRIGLVDQSKPYTQIYLQNIANCTNLFAKNCKLHKFSCKKLQIAQICNLQLEFHKITPLGHVPPTNKHSGRL